MAGHIQNKIPNPCRFSPSGYFGSKAVTICVTGGYLISKCPFFFQFDSYLIMKIPVLGDDKNQVHMEGYQVTNQCMALVRDGCLVPTKDAPELGYVIESSDKQYVPDVYYKVRFSMKSILIACFDKLLAVKWVG